MKSTIEIPKLYKIKNSDRERLVSMYMRAFNDYPKMALAFKDIEKRKIALEATVRFYTAFDMKYGSGFSLDAGLNEAVIIVHSDEMRCTSWRFFKAGSYEKGYREAMNKLTKEERKTFLNLYAELDRMEDELDLPFPHLYIDFMAVDPDHQQQGRGRKLMAQICRYADECKLPIMLFTNTEADINFYKSLGFYVTDVTSSEKFGFVNTYMLYDPKPEDPQHL